MLELWVKSTSWDTCRTCSHRQQPHDGALPAAMLADERLQVH